MGANDAKFEDISVLLSCNSWEQATEQVRRVSINGRIAVSGGPRDVHVEAVAHVAR